MAECNRRSCHNAIALAKAGGKNLSGKSVSVVLKQQPVRSPPLLHEVQDELRNLIRSRVEREMLMRS